MYEIFFVNLWVIILCPVFVYYNLKIKKKTLKPTKNLKKLQFFIIKKT